MIQKRASDLLGKFVGESEANIARMFREAREAKAVLLLDEADSFLRSRRFAERHREVTQVNELLVQMESFDGLFVCCTNLIDDLDEAVFRRFDLKIRFDYVDAHQRWRLFRSALAEHAIGDERLSSLRKRLDQLTSLSVGDFATSRRRQEILGCELGPEELLAALENECELKGSARACLGFGRSGGL